MCESWSYNVAVQAQAVFHEETCQSNELTSLDFKLKLRDRVGPAESVLQKDAGGFLRNKFLTGQFPSGYIAVPQESDDGQVYMLYKYDVLYDKIVNYLGALPTDE